MKPRINYLAVLACMVLHALLGMAWFGYFAKPWQSMIGKTMQELQTGGAGGLGYALSVFQSVLMALLLAWIFPRVGVRSFVGGLRTGFMIGFATIFVSFMTNYTFAMRPVQLALIDCLYPVLSMTLMGGILGAWRTKPKPFANASVQRA